MSLISQFLSMIMLGIGLSMDSFALSVTCGLKPLKKSKFKVAIEMALIFSCIQALTPFLGYLVGSLFMKEIEWIDHWITLGILSLIGINMIKEGIKNQNDKKCDERELKFLILLIMGISTSIDAFAAGITLNSTNMSILPTIIIIFIITFIFCIFGFFFGQKLGNRFSNGAEIFGGIILVLLGFRIWIEHMLF